MNHLTDLKVLGVIPARYGSQRFPGKPLAPLRGKTLLQKTYENAYHSGCFDKLIIATDDLRIYNHVKEFGGEVYITPAECQSGTDRIALLLKNSNNLNKYPIIVNIQGDEPCVSPNSFRSLINCLKFNEDAFVATLITPIKDLKQLESTSIVKCVRDCNNYALYFSRSRIPGSKNSLNTLNTTYYRHIGIYAFRYDFLIKFPELKNTPLQISEDLEQLKILEHGFRIVTSCVDEEAIGVDVPEDLEKVEKLLCNANISLSQAESVHP